VLHRTAVWNTVGFTNYRGSFRPGDMLLINRTKVFPARLIGSKPGGGRLDMLLVRELSPGLWEILTRGKYTGPLMISERLTLNIAGGKTAVSTALSVSGIYYGRRG